MVSRNWHLFSDVIICHKTIFLTHVYLNNNLYSMLCTKLIISVFHFFKLEKMINVGKYEKVSETSKR